MPKILLILNTIYHVEATVVIYFTLKSMGFHCEIYIVNPKDMRYQFFQLMEKLSIKCHIDGNPEFDVGLVMTLHSQLGNPVQNAYHPIIFNNKSKLRYLSHTVPSNIRSPYLKDKKIFFLTPLAENYGYDFIYLFDFPAHLFNFKQHINKIAITSHFERDNRNLDAILSINIEDLDNYEIDIIGTGVPSQLKMKNKINIFENVKEIQFYSILSNSRYLFMPIDNTTKDGTYLTERISSIVVQAQFLNKPIIWHKSIADIYNLPGITFENYEEVNSLIKENESTKFDFEESMAIRKTHNFNVINKILDI